MNYVIGCVHQENGNFGISFPDFPGCMTTAAGLDEAALRGAQALAFHIEGMADDNAPLPQLRNMQELRAEPMLAGWLEGAVLMAIPVELPGKAVRVNISMDEYLLGRLDRAAAGVGQSRSAYLAEAARQRIAGGGKNAA